MSATIFSLRLSLFNAFLFLGTGIQLPFLPLWLKGKGLTESQIALVVAMMMAIRIVAIPLGTYIADRHGDRRRIIVVAVSLSFLSYLSLGFVDGFVPILMVACLAAGMLAPVVPLSEVLAVEGSAHYGIDYGRIRLWASLSFLLGNVIAGALLEVIPVSAVVLLIAGAQGLGVMAALVLPSDRSFVPARTEKVRIRNVLTVVTAGTFMIFVAAASIGQASHGLLYAMGSVHFDDLGHGKLTIGTLWAVGVITEIVMFAFSNRFHRALGSVNLIIVGTGLAAMRWVITGLEPPLAILFAVQMLHAGSFGFTHLGTMHFIRENVPAHMRNTVQGLFSALNSGVLLAATMWSSGTLYGLLGGKAYFVMAVYAAIAFGLALTLKRALLSPTGRAAGDT